MSDEDYEKVYDIVNKNLNKENPLFPLETTSENILDQVEIILKRKTTNGEWIALIEKSHKQMIEWAKRKVEENE